MHRGGLARVFIILALVSFLMDWYIYHGLKTLTTDWQSNRLRQLVLWGYLVVAVGIVVVFIAGLNSFNTAQGMRPFHEWMLSLFLVMMVTKLLFVIVLSIGDLARFITGVINVTAHRKAAGTNSVFPERRKFVSELAVLIAAIPFSSMLYAMFRGKYDYKVHRQTLYFDNLPESFDGFTIAQISDVHSGSFDNRAAVQRGINLINAQKADVFVFTGDLVNNVADEITPYIDMFSQIKAPYGQFSVLGNHDYGDYIQWSSAKAKSDNLQELKNQHKKLGYRLLLDENVSIEKDNQKIVLIGVQNWGRGFIQIGDLDKALNGVKTDDFKVLLSHDPTHWEEKVRYHKVPVQLTLSGHTHGAQFGVETAGFRWSPVQYRYLDWAGLVSQDNRYLYVNRGFGFLAFSGRLGIWPEITMITLKRKLDFDLIYNKLTKGTMVPFVNLLYNLFYKAAKVSDLLDLLYFFDAILLDFKTLEFLNLVDLTAALDLLILVTDCSIAIVDAPLTASSLSVTCSLSVIFFNPLSASASPCAISD